MESNFLIISVTLWSQNQALLMRHTQGSCVIYFFTDTHARISHYFMSNTTNNKILRRRDLVFLQASGQNENFSKNLKNSGQHMCYLLRNLGHKVGSLTICWYFLDLKWWILKLGAFLYIVENRIFWYLMSLYKENKSIVKMDVR